jgi:2-polyprenyl-3-methyl-5-hydroxy-6-metoxy-1,4-benzoquinol methylase
MKNTKINKRDENTIIIKNFYDRTVAEEWERIADSPEFLLTCRMLDRYIKPSDTVLDIGGGPGRYSFYLARKGCDVTLLDLSLENIKFVNEYSVQQNLPVKAICGNAVEADKVVNGQFNHVLLMGPLYHLFEEEQRVAAINAALNLLKPNGILFASFINMIAGIIYTMKTDLSRINKASSNKDIYLNNLYARKSFAGEDFTQVFFIEQSEILPFMERFPLEKLHLFGQQGIMLPCEDSIMAQPKAVVDSWLCMCERLWEREEFFSWSSNLMYVGKVLK